MKKGIFLTIVSISFSINGMQLHEIKKEVSRSSYLTQSQEQMLVILQLHPSIAECSSLLLAGSDTAHLYNICKEKHALLKNDNKDQQVNDEYNYYLDLFYDSLKRFRALNKQIFQYIPKEQEECIPSWQEVAELEQILAVHEGTSPLMLKLSYFEIKEVFDSIHAMLQQD